VFGGIAGDAMAVWVRANDAWRLPDELAIAEAIAWADRPFERKPGDIEDIRESLHECMWEDVGIVRNGPGLARAARRLTELDDALDGIGVASPERAFNLTWHDWLNLSNLILVSRSIQSAATKREESRGAHFRSDYPERSPLERSTYVTIRLEREFRLGHEPVKFSRVRPGESLLV